MPVGISVGMPVGGFVGPPAGISAGVSVGISVEPPEAVVQLPVVPPPFLTPGLLAEIRNRRGDVEPTAGNDAVPVARIPAPRGLFAEIRAQCVQLRVARERPAAFTTDALFAEMNGEAGIREMVSRARAVVVQSIEDDTNNDVEDDEWED
jgi:hypothetical protein